MAIPKAGGIRSMNDLFNNIAGKLVPRDVCARKHGGNVESSNAFDIIVDELNKRQFEVLDRIKSARFGLTGDELAIELRTTPNAISGRITELRIMRKIEKRGTRKTRSGCSAAVWVSK